MRAAAASDPRDDSSQPHRAFGSGKVIRDDSYGHVEVTAIPLIDLPQVSAQWHVVGHSIPDSQQAFILAAARRILDLAVQSGTLRCGVRLIIESGSHHPQLLPAHAEAVELAISDALRRGKFTR